MELSVERLQKGLESIRGCALTGTAFRDWVRLVSDELLAGRTANCWNCDLALHDGPCSNDED